MAKNCVKFALILVVCLYGSTVLARSVPPVMHPNDKTEPDGPSLPIGSADDAAGAHRILNSEDSTGVDALWVTTSAASSMAICDAGGECADVTVQGATFSPALFGLNSTSATYFFDGANWRNWTGTQMNADNVVATTYAPWTGSFLHGYDGATWDRATITAAGDALGAAVPGLDTLSYNLYFDGVNHRRWLGAQMNSDDVLNTTYAPWVGNFNMVYDTVGGNWDLMSAHAAGDALAAAAPGLDTLAHNLFYDGTNYRRWLGAVMNADNVVATTVAPWAGSFLYGYDGAAWDRLSTTTVGDALSATPNGLNTTSFSMFYNGTNYQRWTGQATTIDNVASATPAPFTYNMLYAFDGAAWDTLRTVNAGDAYAATYQTLPVHAFLHGYNGTNYGRVRTDTSFQLITNQTTTNPGYARLQDQDGTDAADVLTTLAAGQATSLNALWSASPIFGYNGATFDPVLVSGTDALMTNTENWPSAFDEGNSRADVKKVAVGTYSPAKETNASIGAAAEDVIASKDMLGYPNWTVYLDNTDGVDPFTDADVLVSPDDTNWISLTWTACDALAAGSACVYQVTNSSYRYAKVQVTAAAGNEVSVDAWITANVN